MNRIHISFFILLGAVLLMEACAPKAVVEVRKLSDVNTYSRQGMFYALPKSGIRLHVTVLKQQINKGIYAEYAERLLGISNAYLVNEKHWKILRVEFEQFAVVDSNQIYRISAENTQVPFLLNLTPEGFLHSFNYADFNNLDYENHSTIEADLKMNKQLKSNFMFSNNYKQKEVVDTIYKEFFRDSVVVLEPTLVKRMERKTKLEQAQEIAKMIFTINDDMHAITIGDGYTEDMPDGKAFELILSELKNRVKEYQRMFTGSMQTSTETFSFEYIPMSEKELQMDILFRFSENKGILSSTDMSGSPVYLEIKRVGANKKINDYSELQKSLQFASTKKLSPEYGLAYRVPEAANMKLYSKSKVFFDTNLYLPQLGSIQRIPINLLKNPQVQILFYPQLGSIKSIRLKKEYN